MKKEHWLSLVTDEALDDMCYLKNAQYRSALTAAKRAFAHRVLVCYLQDRYINLLKFPVFSDDWNKGANIITKAECGIEYYPYDEEEEDNLPCEDILSDDYYRAEELLCKREGRNDAWSVGQSLQVLAWFIIDETDIRDVFKINIGGEYEL